MPTPLEIHPDGDFFPGLSLGYIVVFSQETVVMPAGAVDTWTGVLRNVKKPPFLAMVAGIAPGVLGEVVHDTFFAPMGPDLTNLGNDIAPFGGLTKFVVGFTAPAGHGDHIGRVKLTAGVFGGNTIGVGAYWLKAPTNFAGHESASQDFDDWFNLPAIAFVQNPAVASGVNVTLESPIVQSRQVVKGQMRAVVMAALAMSSPMRISVLNHFVRGSVAVSVGRTHTVRGGLRVRTANAVFVRGVSRLRVSSAGFTKAQTAVSVINVRVAASAAARVGVPYTAGAFTRVPVFVVHQVKALSQLFVGFINIEGMKQDMQIQLGADTRLHTETFTTVPVIAGVTFFKVLQFGLIQKGTETVRRLQNLALSAGGLFGIDHLQGRFAWFGSAVEPIELTYRHSVSKVTDSNMTGAIRKATLIVASRLKAGVDTTDPLFVRGAIELAMSFLLDSATWNAVNDIEDFTGQGRRIDSLILLKRDLERRAFESLSTFLNEPTPGAPEIGVAVRSSAIKLPGEALGPFGAP